ncbi:ribosomal RNA small subunit methyltransferase A [Spirochaetia bacterium]|nr:ribosomal RNA small subunit methyltransferase A [Spirochaetia bacterium]
MPPCPESALPEVINYDSAAALRALLEERGLGMRKKFGQNFLINPGIRKRLVDALEIGAGETVWEVGPGLGAMTRELLDRGMNVRAFEIDPGFIGLLKELFIEKPGFTLVEGDVLKTWHQADQAEAPAPYLLGNLPYNIGAVLLANFIEEGRFFKRMIVTVQKEVARRMAAKPGGSDYSSFSVLIGSAYKVSPLMVIGASSFYPAPRVDSQGIRLDLRTDMEGRARPPLFYPLVRQLFSSRRKTIKNNLQTFVSSRIMKGDDPLDIVLPALEQCGIKPEERAENLTVEQFAELAEKVFSLTGKPGACHDLR